MVAVFDVGIDFCIQQERLQRFGYTDVVDAPAFVGQANTGKALAPPAVAVWLWMKNTKAVDPAIAVKPVHPGTLFRQKSRSILIARRVVNVNLLVCDIIVSAKNDVWIFFSLFLYQCHTKYFQLR